MNALQSIEFSPLVLRELTAAAKRRSTSRVRWWAVLAAIVMSAGFLLLNTVFGSGASLGETCFGIQAFYLFGLALLSGIFLTADCLSEEKREGTIGFLLLTDLSEFDVVMGKFAVTSLTALYGMLALFPVSALPLLLGGVTGVEYWHVSLVQLNSMFVSLAVGIFVSAGSRDPQRAMAGTAALLVGLVFIVPMISGLLAQILPGIELLGWLSPLQSFRLARAFSPFGSNHFWLALAVSHLTGWAFLLLATRRLRHGWRDTASLKTHTSVLRWFNRARTTSHRSNSRYKLLDQNPVLWLVDRLGGHARLAWVIVVLWAVLALTFFFSGQTQFATGLATLMKPFTFVLKTLCAFQACRFFIESRRSGALELLSCTPLTQQDIVRGQTRAYRTAVQWPCLCIILFSLLPICASASALTGDPIGDIIIMVTIGVEYLRLIADLAAICWVGMRLSLYMKKPQHAPLLTVLIVLIAPSVLCWLDLIVDVVLIGWARAGLARNWRDLLQPGSSPPPIPLAPPVIQANLNS